MKLALDYDKTYTLDPFFWDRVIGLARTCGHEARIVTVRDDRFDRTEPLRKLEQLLPIHYTRGVAKLWHMDHFGLGFAPDVWIDDNPRSILENSSFSPEGLAEWRASRGEAA